MYDPTEMAKLSMSVLFTSGTSDIQKLKNCLIDTKASLISEISMMNNLVRDIAAFNVDYVQTEYISFIKDKISEINNITMDYEKAEPLVDLSNKTFKLSNDMDDSLIAAELSSLHLTLSDIVIYDIKKTDSLKPVCETKTYEIIITLRERFEEINSRCMRLRQRVYDCKQMIEICNFCSNYIKECGGDTPPILEDSYRAIIAELSVAYANWRDRNVNSAKNTISL